MLEIFAPDGAEIAIDNEIRGTAPLAGMVLVAAGVDHELRVSLKGEVFFQRMIRLTGGQSKSFTVSEKPDEVEVKTGAETESEEVNSKEAINSGINDTNDTSGGTSRSTPKFLKRIGISLLAGGAAVCFLGASSAVSDW
jgi:hypothetical protein